jgi:hypothetical protein
MRPLNYKERNSMFWQFLFVFVATVLLLLFALFYDFEMPQELNELQKQKLAASGSSVKDQKKLATLIDSIYSSIKQIPTAPNPAVPRDEAGANIVKLKILGKESGNPILIKMSEAFAGYSAVQFATTSNSNNSQNATQALNECKQEISRWKTKYDMLDNQLKSMKSSSPY